MKCVKGYEVEPQKSAAGYYMGTIDYDGIPKCRISSKYAESVEEAKSLPLDRQSAMENEYCNGCGNCF